MSIKCMNKLHIPSIQNTLFIPQGAIQGKQALKQKHSLTVQLNTYVTTFVRRHKQGLGRG